MIMQCRGTDDPSLPLETAGAARDLLDRLGRPAVPDHPVRRRGDLDPRLRRDAADKERLSGMTPVPGQGRVPHRERRRVFTRPHAVRGRVGKVFAACDSAHMPPEAAVGAAFPPAEIAAFTDEDGAGTVQFEVRSDVENESLGCNHKVACSIVVIPINGISCEQPGVPQPSDPPPRRSPIDPTASPTDRRRPRRRRMRPHAPGSRSQTPPVARAASSSQARATSPTRASTRRSPRCCGGRPRTGRTGSRSRSPSACRPTPATCSTRAPPTGFYGSELMAQASLQWAPAYCLNKKRFKFQLNQMSDAAGWNLMESGAGVARVRLVPAPRGPATTRSASPRPRSPASRSATTSTGPTTRASTPTCGSTPDWSRSC